MSKIIQLGSLVQDKVTGFEGVTTGHAKYLTGCDQYLVSHKVDKQTGKKIDGQWFDVNRLDVIKENSIKLDTSEDNGAMEQAPIKD